MNTSEDAIGLLPEDLQRIAEVAGLEAAIRIARAFRGSFIYVPGLDELTRMARDSMIKSAYDNGTTARTLAKEHGITERQIRRIVSNQIQATLPDTLMELLLDRG